MKMTIMKKAKNLKTRVGISKNMGGIIPGGNFLGKSFPGGSFRDIFDIFDEVSVFSFHYLQPFQK